MDDTFVVCGHGMAKFNNFLSHINSIHPSIQFTMEVEKEGKIAFLDVLVTRKQERLGHTVYRKPTHTDRYLHSNSNHHPSQKRGIIKTLADRAKRICEAENLDTELGHLSNALQANGYTRNQVNKCLYPRKQQKQDKKEETSTSKAFLPFITGVTDRIGRILTKYKVKTIYKPTKKLHNYFRSAKDQRDPLSLPGIYRIPCSCGQVYIGQTKRAINTRIKEHKANCRLGHTEKSAVAEHTLKEQNHQIKFKDTQVLAQETNYHTRLYLEAIEIHKHRENFNRSEETLKINRTCIPVLERTQMLPR